VTIVDGRPNGAEVAAPTGGVPYQLGESAASARGGPNPRPRTDQSGQGRLLSVAEAESLSHYGADADEGLRTLLLVRRSRRAAVWLTVAIATVSFVLSFTSLRQLAAASAWPGWSSWLLPLIIDGIIVLATLGIVALAPYRDQLRNRAFFWAVLTAAAAVSVGGNALHAWLFTARLVAWMRCGSAGLACVPPVALLATTHILGTLWRFNPVPPPDARSQLRDRALELAAQRMDRWEAAAAKLHEDGHCLTVPTEKIAGVLWYLYERRPALSLRAIGAKPEVGLHHGTVGKIRDAAAVVLGAAGAEQSSAATG
jgi:hypothetical protein